MKISDIIYDEILEEKMRKQRSKQYIQKLQQYVGLTVNLGEVMEETARLMHPDKYKHLYGKQAKETAEQTNFVLVYMGNYKIDILKSGGYYFNGQLYKDLKEAQSTLVKVFKQKL
tara:strand:- start:4341 stop:4685 length:345 start_codon:yes stop_codon:yes gene_type:complete